MHIECTFLIYYIYEWYIGTVQLLGQHCNGEEEMRMKIGKEFERIYI